MQLFKLMVILFTKSPLFLYDEYIIQQNNISQASGKVLNFDDHQLIKGDKGSLNATSCTHSKVTKKQQKEIKANEMGLRQQKRLQMTQKSPLFQRNIGTL